MRLLRIICIVCFLLYGNSYLFGYDFKVDGLCYNILSTSEKTVELTWEAIGSPYTGNIVVPKNVENNGITYLVTKIGNFAMLNLTQISGGSYFWNDNTELKSVIIPSGVASIGNYAFANCSSITSITFPETLASIGFAAFRNCFSLQSVSIPSNVTSVSDATFSYCTSLKSIYVDNRNNHYCSIDGVLYSKDKKTLVAYPAGSNSSFTVPSGVTNIETYAFEGCSNLLSLSLPNSIVTIGQGAFWNCSGLKSIKIPSANTIGFAAFRYCYGLEEITLPSNLESISASIFSYCSNLVNIKVGDGNNLFCSVDDVLYSKDLKTLYFYPNGKTDKSYTINSSTSILYQDCFEGCRNIEKIVLPNSINTISLGSFWNCSQLKEINLPANLSSIGSQAFYNCSSLETIVSDIQNPISINANTFPEIVYSNATLYVPFSKKSQYSAKDPWNLFKNILEQEAHNYSLSITSSVGGSIAYAGNTISGATNSYSVDEGTSHTLIFTPNSGYRLRSVIVNGTDAMASVKNNQYTISNISQNTTVEVTFEEIQPTTYTLTIQSGNGGFVSYSGTVVLSTTSTTTVNEGTDAKLTFIQYEGYRLKSVVVNDTDVTTSVKDGQYTINNISQNTTVNVSFEVIPKTYSLSINAEGNGYVGYKEKAVSFSWKTKTYDVDEGSSVTLTFTPSSGYKLKIVVVNGNDVTANVNNNQYIISTIGMNTTVEVTFEEIPITTYTLTLQMGKGGTVTYSGNVLTNTTRDYTIDEGTSATLTITPNNGYKLKSVVVNNVDVTQDVVNNKYTINSISQNTIVVVTFEETLKSMTVDNVNYTVASYDNKTVNVAKGSYGNVLTVPATIIYQGISWTVKGIDKGALTGNTNLAAIIWNPSAAFTESVANLNLLLYVKSASYAPSTITNVIVNNVATRISLVDASSSNNFYCPQEFTAKNISYSHSYTMTTGIDKCQGWETIALPFEVQNVSHESKGTVLPFAARTSSSQKAFWLYELTSSGWKPASVIKANIPYIISMPNNEQYYPEDRLNGTVAFYSTNTTVPKTTINVSQYNGYSFTPNYERKSKSSGILVLNVDNAMFKNSYTYASGSKFLASNRETAPFEAYMRTSSGSRLSFGIFDDIPAAENGIYEYTDPTLRVTGVYNMNGQKIKNIDGYTIDELRQVLPAGVYIVNGQKIIVR